ncbi:MULTISPECIES: transposase [unclassified Streptomyces]|uniref:transposase n=1 Tax=unclassified Streptomyces TaxID=2593676 RepID=UPI002251CBC1|nr:MULTISPECIES: transposase [unclassified Streptomyces]MCX4404805.1 transposase [Streptomyces sp. NBC_01764]MCX5190646.1 transposase [Streptomyces sp. NBC_00268]
MRKSDDGAWSPGGHRIEAELDYSRGPEKTWVYGGLRPVDGQAVTMTASSRNSAFYQQFLQQIEDANPTGEIWIVTDNLSSHNSMSTRAWPRAIPVSTTPSSPSVRAGSTSQEGWWRIFRKAALAGRSFANRDDITYATALASNQLNSRAHPWIWADPHHQPALYGADMCTPFGESSTSRPPTSTGDEPVLRKAGVGGPCGRSTRRSDDELRLEGNVQVVRSVSARWPCLARCEWR